MWWTVEPWEERQLLLHISNSLKVLVVLSEVVVTLMMEGPNCEE